VSFQVGAETYTWARKSGVESWYRAETTSTNTVAKAEKLSGSDRIFAFFTDHQTEGRGRNTNTWTSPAGQNLLCTWATTSFRAPQPVLTPLLGLALWRALKSTFPQVDFAIKAPNDIYVGNKKIAGLLVEVVTEKKLYKLAVGLGLNVFAAPIESSTCLSEVLKLSGVELNLNLWRDFLDRWLLELSLILTSRPTEISTNESAALRNALNLYSQLSDKILKVQSDGSLVTETKTISWGEL
jgi:BirA family biotin operon repressor/biotin-[acetyl-CoA-carboxylase] ligase